MEARSVCVLLSEYRWYGDVVCVSVGGIPTPLHFMLEHKDMYSKTGRSIWIVRLVWHCGSLVGDPTLNMEEHRVDRCKMCIAVRPARSKVSYLFNSVPFSFLAQDWWTWKMTAVVKAETTRNELGKSAANSRKCSAFWIFLMTFF